MRIAIATDQDSVASGFGCCPFVTIATVEDGRIRETLLIPNVGASHAFWADLFFRNSIKFVVAGSMGPIAQSTMIGRGIQPVLGASGSVEEAARRVAGGLRVGARRRRAANAAARSDPVGHYCQQPPGLPSGEAHGRTMHTEYRRRLSGVSRRASFLRGHEPHLDDLRATDYERLDRLGHVYLDYTGGGLYAMSQIRATP